MRRFLVLFTLVFSVFSLFSEEEMSPGLEFSELTTKRVASKRKKRDPLYPIENTWKPYIVSMNAIQDKGSVFFQTNIGLGLLYFHQVRGNLAFTPNPSLPQSIPFKRGLAYNRSPLFEYMIGYRVWNWLKFAVSYQNQTGVVIQTDYLPFQNPNFQTQKIWAQYKSPLSLNSLMLKIFIETPYSLLWKKIVYSPFFGLGLGASWQSWTPQIDYYGQRDTILQSFFFRPQTIANFSFMLDKGLRIQPATINTPYSILLGFKFMFWGQTRNLSPIEKQGSLKTGLFKPFKIKTLYSFVPYLGFQWNFPASKANFGSLKKGERAEMSRLFVKERLLAGSPALVTQFNVGPNFLYTSKIGGNLAISPLNELSHFGRQVPYKKRLKYSKAPLYEYFVGSRPKSWVQLGLSVQSQTNLAISSAYVPAILFNTSSVNVNGAVSCFRANLNLTTVMAKAYFFFPWSLRIRFSTLNLFTAVGVGPSWQSWNYFRINTSFSDANSGGIFVLRSKTVANPSMQVDSGLNLKCASKSSPFLVSMGCRFNLWGQVRNLGSINDQDSFNKGLERPVRIRTLYSFAPYLGFQWDFPSTFESKSQQALYTRWKLKFIPTRTFEKRKGILVSANLGPNFLRFANLRGTLSLPTLETRYGSSQLKGRLRRNASLLFEYLCGYQLASWVKIFTSFQVQEGLTVSTKNIPTTNTSSLNPTTQLNSQLSLYSLMLKGYFEIPQTLVIKGLATSLYGAAGVGAGWQSWSSMELFTQSFPLFVGQTAITYTSLRPKTCANLVWMIDFGLRVRGATLNSRGSITFGCKCNQWGQARNLGASSQSWNNQREGLINPVRIRRVYSWAPYMGFQWSF